jgi:hypothetical protein
MHSIEVTDKVLEMPDTHQDRSRHLANERHNSLENIGFSEEAKKRQRSGRQPRDLQRGDKEGKSKKSKLDKEKPLDSGLPFACPFYKWDPANYGGENGCASWAKLSIDTVIRVSFTFAKSYTSLAQMI